MSSQLSQTLVHCKTPCVSQFRGRTLPLPRRGDPSCAHSAPVLLAVTCPFEFRQTAPPPRVPTLSANATTPASSYDCFRYARCVEALRIGQRQDKGFFLPLGQEVQIPNRYRSIVRASDSCRCNCRRFRRGEMIKRSCWHQRYPLCWAHSGFACRCSIACKRDSPSMHSQLNSSIRKGRRDAESSICIRTQHARMRVVCVMCYILSW